MKRVEEKEVKKRKKWPIVIMILLLVGAVCFGAFAYLKFCILPKQVEVKSIESKYKDEKLNIVINLKKVIGFGKVYCAVSEVKTEEYDFKKSKNNKCSYNLDVKDYYIYISNDNGNIKEYRLSDFINKLVSLKSPISELYLAVGESYKIDLDIISLDDQNLDLNYDFSDSTVASINEGVIKGEKDGDTILNIHSGDVSLEIPVHVSDLISSAHIDNTKPYLPCKRYSSDEAKELDQFLLGKVESKGYGTRAGVVEAARFLSMQFPYRLNYFLENGRTTPSSMPAMADGEGRYYRQGLYLSEDKYDALKYIRRGPVMWGCPLVNLNEGDSRPNGLDCSGFVSWTIVNGGVDIGDYGSAGLSDDGSPDLTNRGGDKKWITKDLLTSGEVKAGDLASVPGHVAIIVGIDDNHVYIAEELFYSKGLNVLTFTYDELVATDYFTHIVLMDNVYKNDGIYSAMWN